MTEIKLFDTYGNVVELEWMEANKSRLVLIIIPREYIDGNFEPFELSTMIMHRHTV